MKANKNRLSSVDAAVGGIYPRRSDYNTYILLNRHDILKYIQSYYRW